MHVIYRLAAMVSVVYVLKSKLGLNYVQCEVWWLVEQTVLSVLVCRTMFFVVEFSDFVMTSDVVVEQGLLCR